VSTVVVGTYTLGVINVGLDGLVTAVVPLLAMTDLMLTGSFGLGALAADLAAQLNAALSLQISLGLQVSNPFAALAAQLAAIIQIQAGIAVTLSLGLPAVSVSLSVNLSASIAITAVLVLKVGGLQALIKAALAVRLPVLNLINLPLGLGPCVLLTIGYAAPSTLFSSGNEYKALTLAPLGGINPGDQVFGVIMLTKVPSVATAISAIIKTA
jgi:hypothetical protein